MDLLGTGSIYLEYIYELSDNSDCTLDDFQCGASGQIPDMDRLKKHGSLKYCGIGGHGANVIYALSELKYSVGYLGVVGKDDAGNQLLQQMRNIDTKLMRRFDVTGLKITVFQGSQKVSSKVPNSNNYLSFIEDDLEKIEASKYLFLGPVDSVNSLKAYAQMLNLTDGELLTFFMPGEISSSVDVKSINELISNSRVLFVTEEELYSITGLDFTSGCKGLLALGTHAIVCKSKTDVRVVSKHSSYTIPAKKTILVDDTDYLDSFAAGFLSAYMEGYSLEACGSAGARLSALTSTAYGRDAYPDFKFLKYLLPETE